MYSMQAVYGVASTDSLIELATELAMSVPLILVNEGGRKASTTMTHMQEIVGEVDHRYHLLYGMDIGQVGISNERE